MTWMIGVDEAGYGPNLGPLVVAASVWHVAEDSADAEQASGNAGLALRSKLQRAAADLYARLASIVSSTPAAGKIAIADSKALYKPGGGLENLERAVLVALSSCGSEPCPTSWRALFADSLPAMPWYGKFDCSLPIAAESAQLQELAKSFQATSSATGVQLAGLQPRLVFPREFNQLTEHFGTKGATLSHVSLGLVREVIDRHCNTDEQVFVTCDKHGGRNRYGALLQHHFPEHWIDTLAESGPESRYRWGDEPTCVEIRFRTQGEAELPVALASMTAKYFRELAMLAFNKFWTCEVADLKPTAGYPVDAKRFKAAIAQRQVELKIDESDLWRYK